MELDKAIREEKIKFLDSGYAPKEAEAMAFLTVFNKSDENEKKVLAPKFNELSERLEIDETEWGNLEDSLRKGGANTLDPYGYGIDMTSPLGKMIS